jgi:diguanylate cyclase (GGDEF)-like protein/PAS domain S-box-containing protein
VHTPFPDLNLAALLGAAPDASAEDVIRAALRPFPSAALVVFDRSLRFRLAEGPAVTASGYTTALVRGRHIDDVLPVEINAQFKPQWIEALSGRAHTFRFGSAREGARVYTCEAGPVLGADGTVLGGAVLTIDVTDRALADELVAEAEARYRLLAATATDVVSLHDLDGAYRYVSPSVEGMLGYKPEQLVGTSAVDYAHPADLAATHEALRALIASGEAATFTFRARTASGVYVWLESLISAIRDPATGRVTELRISSRDVSERKDAERQMALATAELRRRLAQTAALARLGEQALENRDIGALLDAASEAVAATLEVPLTSVVELTGPNAPVLGRAGVGWGRSIDGVLIDLQAHDPEEALALLAEGPVEAGDERFKAKAYDERGVVSALHVLIGDRLRPWGVLSACVTDMRAFDAHDRAFLQSVAHVIGAAVARRHAEEQARHEALHDPLTGLPNRALLVDRLAQALRRRSSGRTAVFIVDLDDFKVVNESLGHSVGDELLCEVGPRLAAALRQGDTIAHFSGGSFAVVCESIDDELHAGRLAERLTGAFAAPFVLSGEQLFVSASVGVVVSTGIEGAGELVRDADAAMSRAKEAGKNRYELFDPRLRERAVARLRTESDLRRALGRGELRVHYQPFWSLPDRGLAGVEALVRWEHPERGLVSPGEFIPVAEDSGLIVPIGTWVLREACRQLAAWRREHPAAADLKLRVNLSARQVAQPGLIDVVRAALDDHGVDPASLGLEITEGLLLQDSDAVGATLTGLKGLGIALVLDDFGTGYSSLSYLKRFPIDQLKIDRSFVFELEEREENRALVTAIVGMAGALGLSVVPEGVETEGQLAFLQNLGCEYAQGFLLARPLPPDQLAALL